MFPDTVYMISPKVFKIMDICDAKHFANTKAWSDCFNKMVTMTEEEVDALLKQMFDDVNNWRGPKTPEQLQLEPNTASYNEPPKPKVCVCGAEKTKTTHADWCEVKN